MPCLVPFNNRNLDVSFFVFKSVGVIVEDLVEALKRVSFSSEEHGCAYSSVLRSIHGNLVIWYAAWIKRSDEERELLINTLMPTISNLSNLAILLDYGFFEAYAGESKDGHPNAKFSTGDTVSLTGVLPRSDDNLNDISYACLALVKSGFLKMEGVSAVVCFKSEERPMVASLHVWKSLQSCYTWLLNSDHRETIAPYVKHFSVRLEHDVFRVVYVGNDDVINIRSLPQQTLRPKEEGEDKSVCTT